MPNKIKDILVVDDEQDIRDLLKDFLEGHSFNVQLAEDGLKAIELIEKKPPGIIIVDLLLPGEHGINLIKTVKEKYFIPTIIISGIYKKEEVEDFIEEYFVEGYFEKPVNLNALLKKIKSIVDAKSV